MLVESENLVSVDKFRKDLTKYLAKLRKGSGPFVLLQDGEVMGVLVAPPAYETFADDGLSALLRKRLLETDTISSEQARAQAHAAIRRAARKR